MTQRDPRRHSPQHLKFIRMQPCCVCGVTQGIQAAHLRMTPVSGEGKRPTGMQEKPHDKWTVPLCASCHAEQHKMNEGLWWQSKGKSPLALAVHYWTMSGATDAQKGPRRIKPRKPAEKRKKIVGRSQIPSRPFAKRATPSMEQPQ